jgi:hypothetical protein
MISEMERLILKADLTSVKLSSNLPLLSEKKLNSLIRQPTKNGEYKHCLIFRPKVKGSHFRKII